MTKFPWKLKYIAKYILKAFFLTTFPSTQKKMFKNLCCYTGVAPYISSLIIQYFPLLYRVSQNVCAPINEQIERKLMNKNDLSTIVPRELDKAQINNNV